MSEQTIDTANHWLVTGAGIEYDGTVRIIRPPMPGHRLTQEEALNLAAWLVALADPQCTRFPPVLEAVRNT